MRKIVSVTCVSLVCYNSNQLAACALVRRYDASIEVLFKYFKINEKYARLLTILHTTHNRASHTVA